MFCTLAITTFLLSSALTNLYLTRSVSNTPSISPPLENPKLALDVEAWNFTDEDGFAIQVTNNYSFTLHRVYITIHFDDGHTWKNFFTYLPTYSRETGQGQLFYTFQYDIHLHSVEAYGQVKPE